MRLRPPGEPKRRGIDYLLFFNGEAGAEDLRQNAALGASSESGEFQGARLYELP